MFRQLHQLELRDWLVGSKTGTCWLDTAYSPAGWMWLAVLSLALITLRHFSLRFWFADSGCQDLGPYQPNSLLFDYHPEDGCNVAANCFQLEPLQGMFRRQNRWIEGFGKWFPLSSFPKSSPLILWIFYSLLEYKFHQSRIFFFLAVLLGICDLSYLTRDRTRANGSWCADS